MANIEPLQHPYFFDNQTALDALNLNPIVAKINQLVSAVNEISPTPSQVATPVISVNNGVVTITCSTAGASIRYTTDGSTPTSSSGNVYSAAFTPTSGTTTIKAIAYKSGMTDSAVATESYTPATTIIDITDLFTTAGWTTGSIVKTNGIPQASTLYQYNDYVDISAYQGKLLKFSQIKRTNATSESLGLAFYNSSQEYISGLGVSINESENGWKNYSILIPANAKYIRMTWYNSTGSGSEWANDFYASVVNVESYTDLTSQFANWESGLLTYSTGEVASSTIMEYSTDYVDISAYIGKQLKYSRIKRDTNVVMGIVFYDTSKEYVTGERAIYNADANGWENAYLVVPEGCKYLRVTWYNSTGSGAEWHNDFYAKIVSNS